VTQVEEKIWLVSFMRYDLGFFDHETCRIESAENPFAPKLLPMSPAVSVKVVVAHAETPCGFSTTDPARVTCVRAIGRFIGRSAQRRCRR